MSSLLLLAKIYHKETNYFRRAELALPHIYIVAMELYRLSTSEVGYILGKSSATVVEFSANVASQRGRNTACQALCLS